MIRPRSRILFLLFVPVLFATCMPLRYPRDGEPVSVRSGEALVFGRIRMLSDEFMKRRGGGQYEFLPFSTDPMDHMLQPDPVMSLELRRHEPPGGAFVYKTYPLPSVAKDGSFCWILPAGEYMLASNPRIYGSSRFDPEETEVLARFTIPVGGGTIYVGTLVVTIGIGIGGFLEAWKEGETGYGIRGLRVVDEREEELAKVRGRFPALPEPLTTGLMTVGSSR